MRDGIPTAGSTIMPHIARVAIAVVGVMLISAAAAAAAPLSLAAGSLATTGPSLSAQIHQKPGKHCHPHGHGKLCHGPNDYPALYPRAEREPTAPHRHTRLCRH
jgi:hypothetical protein